LIFGTTMSRLLRFRASEGDMHRRIKLDDSTVEAICRIFKVNGCINSKRITHNFNFQIIPNSLYLTDFITDWTLLHANGIIVYNEEQDDFMVHGDQAQTQRDSVLVNTMSTR